MRAQWAGEQWFSWGKHWRVLQCKVMSSHPSGLTQFTQSELSMWYPTHSCSWDWELKRPQGLETHFSSLLSLYLNSLEHKTWLKRTEDSHASHCCVNGWTKHQGTRSPARPRPCGCILLAASPQPELELFSPCSTANGSLWTILWDILLWSHRYGCLLRSCSYPQELQNRGQYVLKSEDQTYSKDDILYSHEKQTAVVSVYRPIKHPSKAEWKLW